jgi:hypothetical protein
MLRKTGWVWSCLLWVSAFSFADGTGDVSRAKSLGEAFLGSYWWSRSTRLEELAEFARRTDSMKAKQWACYYLMRHVGARGGEWRRALDIAEDIAIGSKDYRVLDYTITALRPLRRSNDLDWVSEAFDGVIERLTDARKRAEVPPELKPPERVVVRIQGAAYAFHGFEYDYDWAQEDRNPEFLKLGWRAARDAELGEFNETSGFQVLEIGDGPVRFLELDSRRPGPWLTVENDRREEVSVPHGWFVQGKKAKPGDLVEPVMGSGRAYLRSHTSFLGTP